MFYFEKQQIIMTRLAIDNYKVSLEFINTILNHFFSICIPSVLYTFLLSKLTSGIYLRLATKHSLVKRSRVHYTFVLYP